MRKAYIKLVGKCEGKRLLGRLIRRWEWEDVDWMNLAQDREQLRALMNTVMNPWVP
jgi:hypothetical protein